MAVGKPDGTAGEVAEAWTYDAGQWKRVFVLRASFSRSFVDTPPAANGPLVDAYPGEWTEYKSSDGIAQVWVSTSGWSHCNAFTADGVRSAYALPVKTPATDSFEVSTLMDEAYNALVSGFVFGGNADMTRYMLLQMTTNTTGRGLFTVIDGTVTRRATLSGNAAAGVVVKLRRFKLNATTWRYEVFHGATVVGTWDDSTGVFPVGSAYRRVGLVHTGQRQFFSNSYSAEFRSFAFADI